MAKVNLLILKPLEQLFWIQLKKMEWMPPYSCRGGVCCSCKAKILEGTASMRLNYSLTEEEIENGYILTCQAHPTSETLIVSYDE